MDEIPTKYLISKGIAFPLLQEGEEPPTMNLECYEYIIKKDEDGFGYFAVCNELHAVTQGENWEELKNNILEVHSLMLEQYD